MERKRTPNPFDKDKGEPISNERQLALWANGTSVHRQIPGVDGGECVPDFSCCLPQLKVTASERLAYITSPREMQMKMLGVYLQAAIECHGKKRVLVVTENEDPGKEN